MTANHVETLRVIIERLRMRAKRAEIESGGTVPASYLRAIATELAALSALQGQGCEASFREGWDYGYTRGQHTPNAYSSPRHLAEDWREYTKERAMNAPHPPTASDQG